MPDEATTKGQAPDLRQADASQTILEFDLSRLEDPRDKPKAGGACLIQIHPIVGRCGVMQLAECTVIGRESTADYPIAAESVSREHAKIERQGDGRYRLIDLDSTNGTFVNDVQVREWDLDPGDVIRCGGAILKLLSANDLEAHYHEVAYMMMTHDSLTGIYNRRYFEESLDRELKRSLRYSSPLGVLLIDLDHFKRVNDVHGHLAGDDVLREFADRGLTLLRGETVLARIGGEEFAILVPESDLNESVRVAERLRAGISSRRFTAANAEVALTVSIGIAASDGSQQLSVGDVMRQADANLYEAKRRGRDRVFATPVPAAG